MWLHEILLVPPIRFDPGPPAHEASTVPFVYMFSLITDRLEPVLDD